MTLAFEDELYDMTETAKEHLLGDDLPYRLEGDVIFDEVPYAGFRTDLVTARTVTVRVLNRTLFLD